MENEDFIKVEAIDFELIPREMGEINMQLNDLYLLAPMDSYIYLTFTKVNNALNGNLKIASLHLNFESNSESDNISDCYFKLDQKIKVELNSWKRNRFK